MKSILGLSVCFLIHLSLLNGVFGQTSSIEMGNLKQHPVIYNRTIEIPPPSLPWYKSPLRWFGVSPPVQNVTYTFPPNQFQRCLIAGVDVNDVEPYGKGGLAKHMDGGPHHSNVTINFSSRTGSAMRFRIIITGYCMPNNPQSTTPNSTLYANPINNHAPNASYGWVLPSNGTFNNASSQYNSSSSYNNSSAIVQNRNMTSEQSWWHFW